MLTTAFLLILSVPIASDVDQTKPRPAPCGFRSTVEWPYSEEKSGKLVVCERDAAEGGTFDPMVSQPPLSVLQAVQESWKHLAEMEPTNVEWQVDSVTLNRMGAAWFYTVSWTASEEQLAIQFAVLMSGKVILPKVEAAKKP